MAARKVYRELESESGATLRSLVEAYDRQLQAWTRMETERVVGRYESQAKVFRELIRCTGGADDGADAGDVMDLESDLRELKRAETAGPAAEVARAASEDTGGDGRS